MKMQFLLVGLISNVLFGLTPVAVAHGGSGSGTGHGGNARAGRGGPWAGHHGGGWAGRGGGAWAGHRGTWGGHGRVVWRGRGRGFHHGGRFFSSGYGFSDFGYPWWWDYPGYSYYPYPSPYYGYGDPYDGDAYDGNSYYGNPHGNSDPRSSATKALQAALARRGYYHGPVDGALGPQTRDAIRSFQAHQGLPVTGQVDGRLIRALQS